MPDKNVFRGQKDEKQTPVEDRRSFHESTILPGGIKQRHCEAYLIFSGTATNLPSGTSHEKSYYDETNDKLYIYNESSSAWKSVSLT